MVDINYQKLTGISILLLIKIIKVLGNNFQFPALSQKHVRNVCHKILICGQISF